MDETANAAGQLRARDFYTGEEFEAARKSVFDLQIAYFERAFKTTENPLYAWWAYNTCRTWELSVPDWVLGYLDRASSKLISLVLSPPEKGEISAAISGALQLMEPGRNGFRNPFAEINKHNKQSFYIATVESFLRRGDKLDAAYSEAALQCDVSTSTIQRAWNSRDTGTAAEWVPVAGVIRSQTS